MRGAFGSRKYCDFIWAKKRTNCEAGAGWGEGCFAIGPNLGGRSFYSLGVSCSGTLSSIDTLSSLLKYPV